MPSETVELTSPPGEFGRLTRRWPPAPSEVTTSVFQRSNAVRTTLGFAVIGYVQRSSLWFCGNGKRAPVVPVIPAVAPLPAVAPEFPPPFPASAAEPETAPTPPMPFPA